jgi:hypothetical protein
LRRDFEGSRPSADPWIVIRSQVKRNILLAALSVAFGVVVIEGFLMWRPAIPEYREAFANPAAARLRGRPSVADVDSAPRQAR